IIKDLIKGVVMDKILHTQITNVFNNIEHQEEEIEIAARLLAQAVMSEGNILLKTFNEASYFKDYFLNNEESLSSIRPLNSLDAVSHADLHLISTKQYTRQVKSFVDQRDEKFIEYVLSSNKRKDNEEELQEKHRCSDLSPKRKRIPLPEFERALNPYGTALL